MEWRRFANAMTRFTRRKRIASRKVPEWVYRELDKPPLTEWEVMAGYGAVEAERAAASKG